MTILRMIFLVAALMASPSFAETKAEQHLLYFEKGDVALEVEVILPDAYQQNPSARYPVLYILDGFWTKEPIQRFYSNLRFDNMIPEVIIVSVGYPNSVENVEDKRLWDLTHVYDLGFEAGGGAPVLLELLSKSVIPAVDSQYRTDISRRVLTGHSLAALFTLYTMYQASATFTHYAAISPSALWADEALAQLDNTYAGKHQALPARVYITYGTDEYRPYVDALRRYLQQLQHRDYDGLELSLASVEGLRHVGMTSEGFLRGMVWAFADIRPSGPSEFEKMNLQALERRRKSAKDRLAP